MANPLSKNDKERLQAARRKATALVQEIQAAKTCGCDVEQLEQSLLELYNRFESINMMYGTGRPLDQ